MGKGDIMMLFSLFFEVYPDGIWTQKKKENDNNKNGIISFEYTFAGTNIFNKGIDVLYKETHQQSRKIPSVESVSRQCLRRSHNMHTQNRSNNSMNARSTNSLTFDSVNHNNSFSLGPNSHDRPYRPKSFGLSSALAHTDTTQELFTEVSPESELPPIDTMSPRNRSQSPALTWHQSDPRDPLPNRDCFNPAFPMGPRPDTRPDIFRPLSKSFKPLEKSLPDTIIQQSVCGINGSSASLKSNLFSTNTNRELESHVLKNCKTKQKRVAEFVFSANLHAPLGKIVKILIQDIQ